MTSAADAIAQVARDSYGRLRACLCSRTHDLASAEDALGQALEMALRQWPEEGVPRVPEAWLLTVARRRLMDAQRRQQSADVAAPDLCTLMDTLVEEPEPIPDRRLALMFVCAHPAIDHEDHAPLMLQVTLGLSAAEIAGAFWTSPAAIGKRLTRAKARVRDLQLRFEVPEPGEWAERLGTVLDALYVAYSRGWKDPTDLDARSLRSEAQWLVRVVVALAPVSAEAWGLLALMLCSGSRASAARDGDGGYVPLDAQDVGRWNLLQLQEANEALSKASQLGSRTGRYQLEAAIHCAQSAKRLTGVDNQTDIAQLYDLLLALVPSPVVRLNRALARLPLVGAEKTAAELVALANEPGLCQYQPYWAARAHVTALLGNVEDAKAAYDIAIGLSEDTAHRQFLLRQQASLRARSRVPDARG